MAKQARITRDELLAEYKRLGVGADDVFATLHRWTAAQDDALRVHYEAGVKLAHIATLVSSIGPVRTVSAVKARAAVCGLSRKETP